MQIRYWII